MLLLRSALSVALGVAISVALGVALSVALGVAISVGNESVESEQRTRVQRQYNQRGSTASDKDTESTPPSAQLVAPAPPSQKRSCALLSR